MKIILSKHTVETKDALTWWDAQEIQAIQMSSAKLNNSVVSGVDGDSFIKATAKLIEKMIVSVKEGDKEIGYSDTWLKSLSLADGSKLYAEIDAIANGDSKKN